MAADGSGQTNLSNAPGADVHPAWSRDGARIAFHSDRSPAGDVEVYVMDADGANPVNLTNSPESFDGRPAWSPDGTRIAFGSSRDADDFEIYVMNADGSSPTRITASADFDSYPEWSPDGAYLAFRSDRTGNIEVFVMQANGAGPVNRSNNAAVDCHPTWTAAAAPAHSLSPGSAAARPGTAVAGVPQRGASRAGERCLGR
jgi:Tol biopolymer transport system component